MIDKTLHQISDTTLAHYNDNADSFWAGTRDHDVSQNIDTLPKHYERVFGCNG